MVVRHWGFAVSASLLITGCMVYENDAAVTGRACRAKSTVDDGKHCQCDTDCKSHTDDGWCFSEDEFGYPRGYCFHKCSRDRDCSENTACHDDNCLQKCTSSDECGSGWCFATEREAVSVCVPWCDEASDCESGVCNVYNGKCLTKGERPEGAGLNAECSEDGECRSGMCFEGHCVSRCDPTSQKCPDDGVCSAAGWCENACRPDAGSDDDAGVACD